MRQNTRKSSKKCETEHVVAAVKTGPMLRSALIDWLRNTCFCSQKTAETAIRVAELARAIRSFPEKNPRGGLDIKWYCVPEHHPDYGKDQN